MADAKSTRSVLEKSVIRVLGHGSYPFCGTRPCTSLEGAFGRGVQVVATGRSTGQPELPLAGLDGEQETNNKAF
jgi:hypothetical protein